MIKKSEISLYPSYYDTYYFPILPDIDILDLLKWRTENVISFYSQIPIEKWSFRYQPEKWSIKEIVQHIIDAEQIFNYRALCFLRNEKTHLPSYDQDEYVTNSNADNKSHETLLNSMTIQAMYTYNFFKDLKKEDFLKSGIANNASTQVGALLLAIIGHDMHHRMVIENNYL